MKSLLGTSVSLVAVAAVGMCLAGATPAAAQDAATIQAIQSQIQQLQVQLKRLQADAARRDAALKAAQEDAAQARAQAAEAQKAAMTPPPMQMVAAPPPPPPPTEPPLPKGAFRVGGVTVTLGGFAALEGIYRSRNQASSIDTNFNAASRSRTARTTTSRNTVRRRSRAGSRCWPKGDIDNAQKLTSYLETDFLSAGTSSNSNQSNSYTLRLRQFWGEYDNSDRGLARRRRPGLELATMNRVGHAAATAKTCR